MRIWIGLLLTAALWSSSSLGNDKDLAVGVSLFTPSGVTFKKWTDSEQAYDLAIGWGQSNLYVHGDYLIHLRDFHRERQARIDLYYGVGAVVRNRDDDKSDSDDKENKTSVGLRVPGGAEVYFPSARLGVYAELALVLTVIDSSSTNVDTSLGIRYYLK